MWLHHQAGEGQGEMWVRVNLVPIKDTEYAVANLIGGREYRFRSSFLWTSSAHRCQTSLGTRTVLKCMTQDASEFRVEGDRYTLVLKEAKLTDEGDIRVRATNRVGVASLRLLSGGGPASGQAPTTTNLSDYEYPIRADLSHRPPGPHNGKETSDDRHTMDVSDKYITLKIAEPAGRTRACTPSSYLTHRNETSSFFVTVTGGWDVWLKAASSRITWTQLSDLIVGSEYRFRVKAENAYGVSEPGEESDKILFEEAKSPTGYENLGTNGGCLSPTVIREALLKGLVGTQLIFKSCLLNLE
ncbi:Myosin light chain kinase, smooth muscle-like 3 [Homarus americanus]|uniref:Myosin light chain kinase, smooth muscle-like 3 n=1 Tax=Homarus americanus TaxID=6706 RepID=A0A8J5N7M7_HOMAM|nr:Myosin light chain kinase, smooth muscle-like 3 [Homarus americanus]